MALINRAGQEISAKVVYYGPGLSGKTTKDVRVMSALPMTSVAEPYIRLRAMRSGVGCHRGAPIGVRR